MRFKADMAYDIAGSRNQQVACVFGAGIFNNLA
jgi:hypothetical protein